MSETRDITLQVGDKEFTFTLTPQDVTKYFNSLTQNNKVAPANNLLVNTIKQEERATLKTLLGNPVMVMQLAGALVEEYGPDVEVIVKKPSTTLIA
ncbi:putative phage tail assembly chaperone [Pseudomonas sp. TNT2022 ID233]|uniref:putative phage tail assembly chaperone n=1 Tax=Pseudomonas aphyarum TaxID=2942629 RepID=UPI00235F2284|nr:putative phage tail assembly chaperone [Pseudomonas aphyarum]MDD1138568.1 putative phage tail assembly chaperone [Pseudomonas aphyarum]